VVHRGCDSLLTERFRDNPAALTCEAVFRAAADGDPLARHIVDRAARILGAGIAGLLHVFDPEIVVLGGQIAEAGEPLFEPIRKEARWRTRRLLRREVPIVPSQVVDHAGIVGAAALILAENR
jgi:glucokinase